MLCAFSFSVPPAWESSEGCSDSQSFIVKCKNATFFNDNKEHWKNPFYFVPRFLIVVFHPTFSPWKMISFLIHQSSSYSLCCAHPTMPALKTQRFCMRKTCFDIRVKLGVWKGSDQCVQPWPHVWDCDIKEGHLCCAGLQMCSSWSQTLVWIMKVGVSRTSRCQNFTGNSNQYFYIWKEVLFCFAQWNTWACWRCPKSWKHIPSRFSLTRTSFSSVWMTKMSLSGSELWTSCMAWYVSAAVSLPALWPFNWEVNGSGKHAAFSSSPPSFANNCLTIKAIPELLFVMKEL